MANEADDVDVQSAALVEYGSALRSVGAQLVRAAELRRRLEPPDRALFDAETRGLLERVVAASRIPLAALEGGVTP
jgi:hypothetical protein